MDNIAQNQMPNVEGAAITGKWYNKLTGECINVRDSIIDGDSMVILSDKGSISMDDFSRYYIQTSDEIYDQSGNVIETKAPTIQEISAAPMYDSTSAMSCNQRPVYDNSSEISITPLQEQSESYSIIKKLLEKTKSSPVLTFGITWDNMPKSEIETIVKILDVKLEDITKYIIENANKNKMAESITKALEKMLEIKSLSL